jgi:hypothetical protein
MGCWHSNPRESGLALTGVVPALLPLKNSNSKIRWESAQGGGHDTAKKGHLKKKAESVGCFYVGLRFFGLFCKNLLHVILTPPARYQHPHDANNPQV